MEEQQIKKTVSHESKNMIVAFAIMIAMVGLITFIGFFLLKPKEEIIMGEAEASVIRISGKVPGRILSYRFSEGESVRKGDTLVLINTPEVYAKFDQAQAAHNAAEAQQSKAQKGLRPEQISSAYELWQKAKIGLDIAEKSYRRIQNLYDKGVIPAQKRDEAEANWKSMQTSEKTAYAQYSMAQQGAEKEDKLLAEALVQKSQGGLNEVNAYLEEGILLSPIDGEIAEIFPHQGELVGTGAPIMNIVDLKDLWVVFHARENLLNDMKIGAPLSAFIPALGDREVHLTVTYLKDMGSYATWKATKTNGQYDAKTFEVRAKPNQPIKDLRPGMSVILKKK